MRLISLTARPSAVAWMPVFSIAPMMPSRLHPSSNSQPRMTCAPAGISPEFANTAYKHAESVPCGSTSWWHFCDTLLQEACSDRDTCLLG